MILGFDFGSRKPVRTQHDSTLPRLAAPAYEAGLLSAAMGEFDSDMLFSSVPPAGFGVVGSCLSTCYNTVMSFFKRLGLWNWEPSNEEYRGESRASYPHLRKLCILVHNKENNVDMAEAWKSRRRINYERLWEWLIYGENF